MRFENYFAIPASLVKIGLSLFKQLAIAIEYYKNTICT